MHRLARSGWVQSRRAAAGTLAWPAAPPLAAPISSVVWQAVRLASSRSGEASAPERPEGAPRKRKVVRKVVVRRKRATEAAAPEPAPGPVSSASSAAAAAALADDTVPGVLPAAPKAAAANSTHAGPGPPPTDGDGESGYIAFTKDLEGELARQDHGPTLAVIRALYSFAEGMDLAAASKAMDATLWARCVARLRGELLNRPTIPFEGDLGACHAFLRSAAAFEESGDTAHLAPAVDLVLRTGERHFRPILEAAAVLRQTADLRQPASWYPEARKMRRKIVLHTGPTNSGKTYSALQRLREAGEGLYCGPLRLLALEVYETLNQEGSITNLVTGQERRELMFATHTSCTVEMASLDRPFDVAVIDEVQMIGDDSRGWAWTRALLGLQAKEVHVCGDAAAAPVVRKLAAACGDELEERTYERRSPLAVCEASLGSSFRNVRKGDAVVAFRRRDIYQIRRLIERSSGRKCCVVYGRLPPETRNAQARLFNDPASGYDVLVASDAIGMGLNLNIKRVVFSELTKFNGTETAVLSASQMKQIAGRAGRAGGIYPEGEVAAFNDDDVALLLDGLAQPSDTVESAGLLPSTEQIILFAESWRRIHGSVPQLSRLLANFIEASQLDGDFFMCDSQATMQMAQAIERIPNLTLDQQHDLTAAPIRLRDPGVRASFTRYAKALADKTPVPIDVQLPIASRATPRHLDILEGRMQAIELYCWLANRFPLVFTDMEAAEALREKALTAIESGLEEISGSASEAGINESTARRAAMASGGRPRGGGKRPRRPRQAGGRPVGRSAEAADERR